MSAASSVSGPSVSHLGLRSKWIVNLGTHMHVVHPNLGAAVVPMWLPVVRWDHLALVADEVAAHILTHRVHVLPGFIRQLVRAGWILGQQPVADPGDCARKPAEIWRAAAATPTQPCQSSARATLEMHYVDNAYTFTVYEYALLTLRAGALR